MKVIGLLTIGKVAKDGQSGLSLTQLEIIKLVAVLGDGPALLLGVGVKVGVILTARTSLVLREEVAATTTEEDVDDGAEGMDLAQLLLGDEVLVVAIGCVSRVCCSSQCFSLIWLNIGVIWDGWTYNQGWHG
jgi:hypothetical protein